MLSYIISYNIHSMSINAFIICNIFRYALLICNIENRNEYDQKIGTRFTSGNKTNYLERESSPHSSIFNYDENHIYGEY